MKKKKADIWEEDKNLSPVLSLCFCLFPLLSFLALFTSPLFHVSLFCLLQPCVCLPCVVVFLPPPFLFCSPGSCWQSPPLPRCFPKSSQHAYPWVSVCFGGFFKFLVTPSVNTLVFVLSLAVLLLADLVNSFCLSTCSLFIYPQCLLCFVFVNPGTPFWCLRFHFLVCGSHTYILSALA